MSMNRYANAGPIMAGLAAMSEPELPASVSEPFPFSAADLLHKIGNIAGVLSEVEAQLGDIRKRLDAIEGQKRQPHSAPYGGIPSGLAQASGLDRNAWQSQLQAQQSAMTLAMYGISAVKGPSST